MTRKRLLTTLAVLAVTLCLAGAASGALIEFTDSTPWQDAYNQPSFTYDLITLTAGPEGAVLWQDGVDGVAVQSGLGYEGDEIEGSEYLEISFSRDVRLNTIYVADLFYEQGYYETGAYSINSGPWMEFSADDPTYNWRGVNNGEIYLTLGTPHVSSILFMAPGQSIPGQGHEYAVQGIGFTAPVPEPATLFLLGSGLAGAGYFVRRRRKR